MKDERTASWTLDESPLEVSLDSVLTLLLLLMAVAFSLSSRILKPRAGAGALLTTGCCSLGAAAAGLTTAGAGFAKAAEDLAGWAGLATAPAGGWFSASSEYIVNAVLLWGEKIEKFY